MSVSYGYARVSSKDQHEDRQIVSLLSQGIKPKYIYVDKQSGKDFDRPLYKKLIRRLREDDVVFILSIDRLGRNYEEIQEQWRYIVKEKKADIVVIDMPLLDTRRGKDLIGTFLSDVVLQVLSFVSENERMTIRKRQAEGIAAAKARGVKFGRPSYPLPENFGEIVRMWKDKEIDAYQAMETVGMPRSTFYAKAKAYLMENDGI